MGRDLKAKRWGGQDLGELLIVHRWVLKASSSSFENLETYRGGGFRSFDIIAVFRN